MLGYLEQSPLYNAANFSWAVGVGPWLEHQLLGHQHHLNGFICPSDGMSPSPSHPRPPRR